MASYQYLNSSHQLRNSSCSTHNRPLYSKAQICFFNILRIISSIPPSTNSRTEPCPSPADDRKGIDIDLNLELCYDAESGVSESFVSDSSGIQGNRGGGEEDVREKSVGISEATDSQVQSFQVDNNGVDHEEPKSEEETSLSVETEQGRKGNDGCDGNGVETVPFAVKRHEGSDHNCLDLLVEAAKLVSAKDESNSEEASGLSRELRTRIASQGTGMLDLEEQEPIKKRKQRWVVVDLCSDMDDTSPVVRSKRGRSQALPYRFRDSVVEPLKRSGRSTTGTRRKRLIGS